MASISPTEEQLKAISYARELVKAIKMDTGYFAPDPRLSYRPSPAIELKRSKVAKLIAGLSDEDLIKLRNELSAL